MAASERVVEQAGAVVFRRAGDGVEILLVSPKGDPEKRIFPKGHIEPGEHPADAALREAREEAGVSGRWLAPLHPALDFQSGKEAVRVTYYLVEACDWRGKGELRSKEWLVPDEALPRLTHDDARTVLHAALAMIETERGKSSSSGVYDQFLIQELSHAADSLLQNEQDGERRLGSFIVVVGAAAGVIGVVFEDELKKGSPDVRWVLFSVIIALFLLGFMTLMRLAHRNLATDALKAGMKRTRIHFVGAVDDPRRQHAPFDPYRDKPRPSVFDGVRFGWVQTMSLLLALMIAGAVAMLPPTLFGGGQVAWATGSGVATLLVLLLLTDLAQKTWPPRWLR